MRVILAIHGYTGRPLQEVAKWCGAAGDLGAIVIAPAGTPTSGKPGLGWNVIHCCGDPVRGGVNNLDFVVRGAVGAFLGALDSGIDAYVIATGFSNGGFLLSLLGLLPGAGGVGGRPAGYQYGVRLYGGGPTGPGLGPLPAMSHHGGRDAVPPPWPMAAAERRTGPIAATA